MRGKLIAIEGVDCAGKSLQTRVLGETLARYGVSCLTTREPGGTPLAEQIRAWLLENSLDVMVQTLLFSAARRDHLHRVIAPALSEGRWVVCDRFRLSTLAYQGGGGGLARERLQEIERAVFEGIGFDDVDWGVVLDIDYGSACERKKARGGGRERGRGKSEDPFEGQDEAFFSRVREAFLMYAREEERGEGEERWQIIDARRSADAVAQEIERQLVERFALGEG